MGGSAGLGRGGALPGQRLAGRGSALWGLFNKALIPLALDIRFPAYNVGDRCKHSDHSTAPSPTPPPKLNS